MAVLHTYLNNTIDWLDKRIETIQEWVKTDARSSSVHQCDFEIDENSPHRGTQDVVDEVLDIEDLKSMYAEILNHLKFARNILILKREYYDLLNTVSELEVTENSVNNKAKLKFIGDLVNEIIDNP